MKSTLRIKQFQYLFCCPIKGKSIEQLNQYKILPIVIQNKKYNKDEVLNLINHCKPKYSPPLNIPEINHDEIFTAAEIVSFLNSCTCFSRNFRFKELAANLLDHRYINHAITPTMSNYSWMLDNAVLDEAEFMEPPNVFTLDLLPNNPAPMPNLFEEISLI